MSSAQFALGTFAVDGDEPFPGLVVNEMVSDLRTVFGRFTTTQTLLSDWERSFERLTELAGDTAGDAHPLSALRPLPPLTPRQILCAGANYRRHVLEIVAASLRLGGDTRSEAELHAEAEDQLARRQSTEPYMFVGLPSALCGALDDVVLWAPGECHDWELELAVVIGRDAHGVDPEHAMEHVAGYTICNDISVRDVMQRPRFPMTDFVTSKNRPTYFPTGPLILPRQLVPDYRELRITLAVNGETMQDETVQDIIYGVEELVAYASRLIGLRAGDLLLTGSPAGNAGQYGDRWLRPGDVMDASITGLGSQRNVCVAPPA